MINMWRSPIALYQFYVERYLLSEVYMTYTTFRKLALLISSGGSHYIERCFSVLPTIQKVLASIPTVATNL
jgi:hypothetical protein